MRTQQQRERGQVSFAVLTGVLLVVMTIVGLVVARTNRGNGAAVPVTASILSPVVDTLPTDVAALAPTTVVVETTLPPGADAVASDVATVGDTLPETGLATPQAAAKNLWDAWRDLDEGRARLYASDRSVEKLFSSVWTPQVRQAGCTVIAAGWLCRFEGPKYRWDMSINGNPEKGYRVTRVFVGEPTGDLIPPGTLPQATTSPRPGDTTVPGVPRPTYGPPMPPVAPDVGGIDGIDGVEGDAETTTTVGSIQKPNKKKKAKVTAKPKVTKKVPAETPAEPTPEPDPPAGPKPETPAPEPEPEPAPEPAPSPVPVATPVPVANPE